jgi:hypothetical protein
VVTIESGPDVHASKRRIAELGIGRHVFWFPLMCRKDLMVGLAMADIVCGEFTHSAMSYGVVHEAQTIARPLLTYRDDEYHRGQGAELYPILNARTSDQIASQLARFTGDPASFAGMGAAGHQWYRRCVVDAALARYLAFLGVATEAAAQAGSGGFVPSYSSRG